MMVTNLVSPLMVSLDRFLIGAYVSMAAVAYYTTPFQIATNLSIFTAAMVGVLFPAFSASFVHDRTRSSLLFKRGTKYVFLSLFPIILVVGTLAHEGFNFWLGAGFAQNSTRVLQWLAVGVLFNNLAQVPFALVQGAGRPDLTAKLHLVELPLYLGLVLWSISSYGINGAAIAWTMRTGIDMLVLMFIAYKYFVNTSLPQLRIISAATASLLLLFLSFSIEDTLYKYIMLMSCLVAFVVFGWFFVLEISEKDVVKQYIKSYCFSPR